MSNDIKAMYKCINVYNKYYDFLIDNSSTNTQDPRHLEWISAVWTIDIRLLSSDYIFMQLKND